VLDGRFDRRLTVVTAGPGFGKTTLLTAALSRNHPTRRDIWLSCEPADASAEHLTEAISTAASLPGADLGAVMEWLWSLAPEHVCLVIDDLHEVPVGSTGATVIERVLEELPRNAHLLLASREAVPLRLARLAAAGELARLTEEDLLLDADERTAFAHLHEVEPSLLHSTGGWPALAALVASAGTDLVLDYLWDEVLDGLGPDRTRRLAELCVVGEADDEIAAALSGTSTSVRQIVEGVPLVEHSASGGVSLHPLWQPALRTHLSTDERRTALMCAARVHRTRGRYRQAVALLVEAECWDQVLHLVRDAERHFIVVSIRNLISWCDALPADLQTEPEVLLARGLARRAVDPDGAVPLLVAARQAFAARHDVEGEMLAIAQEGLVHWWNEDHAELLTLIARLQELSDAGSDEATSLLAIGEAALAHLVGDSNEVRSHLDRAEAHLPAPWLPTANWLRSVAHRRDGDLALARLFLGPTVDDEEWQLPIATASLRTGWLEGEVEATLQGWEDLLSERWADLDEYNHRESMLELARIHAWLGRPDRAEELLARTTALVGRPSPLSELLELLARAAVAVARGDESAACEMLDAPVRRSLGSPDAWYWRDRAAIALTHVLVPACREQWGAEPLGVAHGPAVGLALALEGGRVGDLDHARRLTWPSSGVVRTHLPAPWIAELVAVGRAAGATPPPDLADSVTRRAFQRVAATHPHHAVASAAAELAASVPPVPSTAVAIRVIGPLEVDVDSHDPTSGGPLRRRRVRELLSTMVAHRTVRRDAVADELWPDHPDPRQNLRVTLTYVQQLLQPDRAAGEPPYFLRADGTSLWLEPRELLTVDAWTLDDLLTRAEEADRLGRPSEALAAIDEALPLWRGEPYVDAPDAPWVVTERERLRARVVEAALRAGELRLATGDSQSARAAAEHALRADHVCERAHALLIRCHLATGDLEAAERALDRCRAELGTLDLQPSSATVELVTTSTGTPRDTLL
jgi:LuxR family transcriptional regulator, maltose regulon positive regulatory protein